jgi:hypothetical protein
MQFYVPFLGRGIIYIFGRGFYSACSQISPYPCNPFGDRTRSLSSQNSIPTTCVSVMCVCMAVSVVFHGCGHSYPACHAITSQMMLYGVGPSYSRICESICIIFLCMCVPVCGCVSVSVCMRVCACVSLKRSLMPLDLRQYLYKIPHVYMPVCNYFHKKTSCAFLVTTKCARLKSLEVQGT